MSTTVLVSTSTRWQQRPAKETGRRHSCPRDHITDAAEIDARGPTDKPDRLVGDSGGRLAVELLAHYEQGASIREMVEPTGHSYGFIRDLLQAPRTHPLSKSCSKNTLADVTSQWITPPSVVYPLHRNN